MNCHGIFLNKSGKLASFRWSHYVAPSQPLPPHFSTQLIQPHDGYVALAERILDGISMACGGGPGWLVGIPRRGRFHTPQNLPILERSPKNNPKEPMLFGDCAM